MRMWDKVYKNVGSGKNKENKWMERIFFLKQDFGNEHPCVTPWNSSCRSSINVLVVAHSSVYHHNLIKLTTERQATCLPRFLGHYWHTYKYLCHKQKCLMLGQDVAGFHWFPSICNTFLPFQLMSAKGGGCFFLRAE